MKKAISILLAFTTVFSLAACGLAPEEVITVPTDMDRIVEIAAISDNPIPEAAQAPQAPAIEYAEEHYTFSATAADGLLNIHADAAVRYPASLQLPVARVSAVGFTQEQAIAYFDYFFEGEQPIVVQNYGSAKVTKQSLRDLIALYEQQIADGTIMEQSLLTADEARKEIERLEELIPSAPETVPPEEISDGTMLPGIFMHNDDPEPLLELNVETDNEHLHIYAPVNAGEHAEGHFFYYREDALLGYREAKKTALALNTSIEGMTLSWDDAMAVCQNFFALGGVTDMTVSEAFRLEKGGKSAYRFHFVRTVEGIPLAINHESSRYKGVKTPWGYEECSITMDDRGLYDVSWGSPTKTIEIVNPAAMAIPFAQAATIFETMAVEFYEVESVRYDGLQWDYAVTVDDIQLSLLRIRDVSTDERTGLYVPAWVFYGKTTIDDSPNKNWEPAIVFAINALDGSVIDLEKGH